MKISVIIPTHNRAYVLDRSIESVLKQTHKPHELIVVDDGSTDETERFLKKYPELKVIRTENRGVSHARNVGVAHATGEWIAFLDSDDEWLPKKLEKQVRLYEQEDEHSLIHGEEIWIRNGKQINQKKIHKKSGGDLYLRSLKLCLISPSAVLMKKSLLEEMGGFDEEMIVCEDYDLWLKVTSLYKVGFVEEPIIRKYGGHEDQLSHRYRAMDYYRVVSMDRILKIRDLSTSKRTATIEEILYKTEILLNGYKKHGNLEHYNEVERIHNHWKQT